jgi:hypothetical protein
MFLDLITMRAAPAIEYIGRNMRGWFDFAIADELHQSAGDTAQGNGLGVLGRAAQRLIALTGALMGGYADDLFNIFYRIELHAMVREGFAYDGQGRRDFLEQYGVLETIEKVEERRSAGTALGGNLPMPQWTRSRVRLCRNWRGLRFERCWWNRRRLQRMLASSAKLKPPA